MWRRLGKDAELTVLRGTFTPLEANVVARAMERWALVDEPTLDADRDLRVLLREGLWNRLGAVPRDADRRDEWQDDHQVFAILTGLGPQRLRLESVGFVGGPSTRFVLHVNGRPLDPTSLGPISRSVDGKDVPLLPGTWEIVRRFEGTEGRLTSRAAQLAWLGSVRESAAGVHEALGDGSVVLEEDEHLATIVVHTPSHYKLAWEPRENDPRLLDLKVSVAGAATPLDLFRLDGVEPIVQQQGENIVLDTTAATVARIAQKNRGKLRKQLGDALTDPSKIIPEGLTLDHFDLDAYSERVLGFEPATPANKAMGESSGIDWFTEDEGLAFLSLDIRRHDGTRTIVEVPTVEDARRFQEAVRRHLAQPMARTDDTPGEVEVGGRSIPASPHIAEALDVAISRHDADVLRNDGLVVEATPTRSRMVVVLEEPHALPEGAVLVDQSRVPWNLLETLLRPGFALHPHQRDGVAWLWSHFTGSTPRGVLLADDMGLGKTLQIACIAALRRADTERPRLPSLIVAPVILLDNWESELRLFFVRDAFPRVLILHGDTLSRFRRRDGSLDDVQIAEWDLVLTNYDTLQAYQQSLLRIDWAIVALDEAHNIKNASTYRSRAARGLKRELAIAATGTPVENKLSDLWSLFDFASPGAPFTELESFRRTYEATGASGIRALREHLRYPHQSSKVMRRTKEHIRDLPPKELHVHHVPMTLEQTTIEQVLVRKTKEHGHLRVLQGLQKLYQHPALLLAEERHGRADIPIDIERAMETSPKLRLCLDVLDDVRMKGEKALVFTLWLRMQALLAEAIRLRFGLRSAVPIINGDPSNRERAKQRIDDLAKTDGFGVMILSPLAAGTGLNIQCANHVIHYGRWWNPAKEDQATDRAHRIGQTRPVHVHHLLMHWPGEPTRGFDVKLHELVERKRAVARQFLAPQEGQGVSEHDMNAILCEAGKDEA